MLLHDEGCAGPVIDDARWRKLRRPALPCAKLRHTRRTLLAGLDLDNVSASTTPATPSAAFTALTGLTPLRQEHRRQANHENTGNQNLPGLETHKDSSLGQPQLYNALLIFDIPDEVIAKSN
jgi:hypothetical protein